MIYFIQLLIISIAAFLCYGTKRNRQFKNKIFLLITFILLVFIMGLRDVSVGVDNQTYMRGFAIIKGMDFEKLGRDGLGFELGWQIWMKICSELNPSYYFFQIVCSIVYTLLSINFINNSEKKFPCLIVYLGMGLFTGAFNIQRQLLAALMLANGMMYLMKNKKKTGIMFWILAPLIHYTACLFLLAGVVYVFRDNEYFIRICLAVAIICAIKYKDIIELTKKILPRYSNYYTNTKTIMTAGYVWIIWGIIFTIGIIVLFGSKYDISYKLISLFSMGYVITNIVGLQFNYFERIGVLFQPFTVLLFSEFGKYFKGNVKYFYYTGLTISFSIYYMISCIKGDAMDYKFFF